MAEHGYQQYCGLARALDVAGDKWTLLIVRELMPGPRRFTDLLDGLPGMSRKLLTDRLRALEADGVLVHDRVYALTEDGRDLARAMAPLIAWGGRRMGEPGPDETFRPRWSAVGMASVADREAARGVRETYQYVIGDTAFHFVVDDGVIDVRDGRASDAAVTVAADEATWADVIAGRVRASEAGVSITGERDAVRRLRGIFGRR